MFSLQNIFFYIKLQNNVQYMHKYQRSLQNTGYMTLTQVYVCQVKASIWKKLQS